MNYSNWRLGHRPALHGVRAIAIILVIASHVEFPYLTGGGPVGVTVFFTLSGFLITALLLEEGERSGGRIDLKRFYVRRFRRLAPAATVNIAATAVAALFLADWWMKWGAIPPALFYYANWAVVAGQDLGMLGGYWSLSIEEQFYFVWPIVIIFVARRGPRAVMAVAALGTVASLLVRLWLWFEAGADFVQVYYRTDAVASALLVGALLAAWAKSGAMPRPIPGVLSIGLAGILASSLLTGMASWYLGPVLATAGVAFVIWATATGANQDAGPAWLRSRVMVYIGERSYSLYLWHIGLAAALRSQTDLLWPVMAVLVGVFSLIAAELSYRFVESPFRAPSSHLPGRDAPASGEGLRVGG